MSKAKLMLNAVTMNLGEMHKRLNEDWRPLLGSDLVVKSVIEKLKSRIEGNYIPFDLGMMVQQQLSSLKC